MTNLEERARQRIRVSRKLIGLSQTELGRRVGMLQTTVTRIETGERGLGVNELADFADAFGKDLDYFLAEPTPAEIEKHLRAKERPFHNAKTAAAWVRGLALTGEAQRVREAAGFTAEQAGAATGLPIAEWESGEAAIVGSRSVYLWARWLWQLMAR